MDFWKLMVKKDDYILGFIDFFIRLFKGFNLKAYFFIKKKNEKNDRKDSIFIIFNSPSVKDQDISALQGSDLMFVNRGFKHPSYAQLQPKYHIFIDPKMLTGEWDVAWLDEIHEASPDIIFILPFEWYYLDLFQPYIKKGYKFHWLPPYGKCKCLGVGGVSFKFATDIGYKEIYFTGYEATGLAHELIKSSSHFYGVNEENSLKTSQDYERDLYMMSRHLHELNKLAATLKKKNIKAYNLTKGGILDMFERKDLI